MNLFDSSALLSFLPGEQGADVVERELAARLCRTGSGLSLADRLCLATADRLHAVVWTADTAWGRSDRAHQVR